MCSVRIVRHLLMVLALLSVAALPGPSHAMPNHDDGDAHIAQPHYVESADRFESQQTTASHDSEEHGCPGHDHGKCCVTACCASTCLPLAELTSLPAPRWTFVTVGLRGDDVARAGAVLGLPKRPPKTV
ncbi:hypothetical protein RHAL1_00302 [Beijerinckiaceae bacterium RH AL1]|nr:hypothetical protein RHAL8_00287 [Beijerinckiaceae bacterium RH AL8]VVB42643.1 hypothetical protein RHCH11_RHCH11_00289 [Beijerinckiaceae bacterium RH CH11]VVC53421.1 hypothetical protein RHAL1_00302 [Beijerinckiaceae bacterium RH AL1]